MDTRAAPPAVLPPERVKLRGMVLRRWSEADVDASLEAVAASHEHLRPWMPWAAQPPERARTLEFVRSGQRDWRSGLAYGYGVFDPAEAKVLGGIGLHRRLGPGALEIGYWVHVDHTRQGVATTAAAVVTDVAFALPGTDRVEIHCDEANTASAAVPRRLGYRLARVRDRAPDVPAATGREMIWVMSRAHYPGSAAARYARAALR